jgi:hypothetical protein
MEFREYLRLSLRPSTYPTWYKWMAIGLALPALAAAMYLHGFWADFTFFVFVIVAGCGSFLICRKLGVF